MKIKLFILLILFLGMGMVSYAQEQSSAPSEKKETPSAQIVAPDHAKTNHATADCKWVDANGDGKCDTCGKTKAECDEKCSTAEPKKSCCSSSCSMHKSCGEATSPSKDGKKDE